MTAEAKAFCEEFNRKYEEAHKSFEDQFWGTKMALKDANFNAENLSRTKKEMEDILSDPAALAKAEELRKQTDDEQVAKVLDIIIRACHCYSMPPEAKDIREATSALESNLEMARNGMKLGYKAGDGNFVEASSVALRNKISTEADESIRKAAYEGLRSIGPFVLDNGFIEIIKKRNQMAKKLGYIDYYDYKVTQAEGFGKPRLFEMLDDLEQGTRPILKEAREEFARRFGDDALLPWNMSYKMKGNIVAKMDPYFPFGMAVERYVRSYSAMGITYEGATMNLDLLDRKNKYSNGFCHWPACAWVKPDGTFQPSTTNFTSLADPTAIGSGLNALRTLMHEAGHAAHFANIKQPSPLFSQERAPTSVAYAENQSMFLDSLVEDAAWRAKYARDKSGTVIPFEILEEDIRASHPFAVFALRGMLSVSYFEKALYELPEEEVTKENILALADKIELEVQGGPTARPLLSIPHLVSDEASCYYHGYTLAEMSVYQTREFFLEKYGYIVDNPEVGPTLRKAYWECGNSKPFLTIVKDLTGKELVGTAWVNHLKENVDDKVKRAKKEFEEATPVAETSVDLNMTVRFVDGDELIADSSSEGGILEACKKFEQFVAKRVAAA
ncbi:Peptidase family M3 [Seminavis robusta]|uniref:Peptidase family M3 n=1 Tax=Seminavis robusta TaxID=568900 RepID=A0A9N8EJY5_9STRA|nr:Peptidase family M3 [Seminavis robusta]|eukprot:Sro1053_g235830.1 Peptidase family M3 (615) ;mRNA; r:8213-10401